MICLAEVEWRENLIISKGITLHGAAGGKTTVAGAAEMSLFSSLIASNAEYGITLHRLKPTIALRISRGWRFGIQAQGLEEMSP